MNTGYSILSVSPYKQDQLGTTSSNYEKQLSAMSDHVCELNDKLVKQSEEMDSLRKAKVRVMVTIKYVLYA